MANVQNMQIEIDATLIRRIGELEALVVSYRKTNSTQHEMLVQRQNQLNTAIESARKTAKQLDVALQEAKSAAEDCGTALDQRDSWRRKAEESDAICFGLAKRLLESSERLTAVEAQLERENDLWVVMPGKQEMVQLRWYRQKVEP